MLNYRCSRIFIAVLFQGGIRHCDLRRTRPLQILVLVPQVLQPGMFIVAPLILFEQTVKIFPQTFWRARALSTKNRNYLCTLGHFFFALVTNAKARSPTSIINLHTKIWNFYAPTIVSRNHLHSKCTSPNTPRRIYGVVKMLRAVAALHFALVVFQIRIRLGGRQFRGTTNIQMSVGFRGPAMIYTGEETAALSSAVPPEPPTPTDIKLPTCIAILSALLPSPKQRPFHNEDNRINTESTIYRLVLRLMPSRIN